ncbi:MAG: hypothetical protein O2824_00880, partial [Proteobacteria bacterium]|nr:hypothetical protein [Pseudomonadota bacterium]
RMRAPSPRSAAQYSSNDLLVDDDDAMQAPFSTPQAAAPEAPAQQGLFDRVPILRAIRGGEDRTANVAQQPPLVTDENARLREKISNAVRNRASSA